MMRYRIEDLPTELQSQVRRKMEDEDSRRQPQPESQMQQVVATATARRVPTKTEADYLRQVLNTNPAIRHVVYEGLTFRLANGHRYTPDWVFWAEGRLHCVEIKGAYRLGSYQRARLAFDQAAVEWPSITWIWAERKDGEWQTRQQNSTVKEGV